MAPETGACTQCSRPRLRPRPSIRDGRNPTPSPAAAIAPRTLVMLFGPRDEAELDTIWQLIQISYGFARGPSES